MPSRRARYGAARAAETFNRQVGNRTGNVARTPTYRRTTRSGVRGRAIDVARGASYVPRSATTNYNRILGQGPGGGGGSRSTIPARQDALANAYTQLTNDFTQNQMEQEAINSANENKDEDRGWLGDVWNAVTGGAGLVDDGSGFAGSIIGRGLDIINRPAYGLYAGLENLAGQETHRGYNPGDMGYSLGNFFSGVGHGLTGERKAGFGGVYENLQENPTSSAGRGLKALEEAHPELEQWISRGVGLAGELFVDPTNNFIPSLPKYMRGTGELATAERLQNVMTDAARHEAANFHASSGLIHNSPFYEANPNALTQRIADSTDRLFAESAVDVQRGGARGTRLLNNRAWPALVASNTGEEVRRAMTDLTNSRIDRVFARAGTISSKTIDFFRSKGTDFDDFWQELSRKLEAAGKVPAGASTDDILQAIARGDIAEKEYKNIFNQVVSSKYDPQIEQVRQAVFESASNPTYRAPGVRLYGHDFGYKPVGKAFSWANTKLSTTFPSIQNALDGSIYERMFSGLLGLKGTRAAALGFEPMNAFRDELKQWARKYTRQETFELQQALEKNLPSLGSQRMDDALKYLRDKYDSIFADEITNGARHPNAKKEDMYAYIFNRGGTRDARTKFKNGRKDAFKDGSFNGPGKYTMAKAKADGLKPVENAFAALDYRMLKSRRDASRALFYNDLVRSYAVTDGTIGKLSKDAAEKAGLIAAKPERLEASLRASIGEGRNFYMPKEFHEVANMYDRMSSWTSSEWGIIGRNLAKITTKMKQLLTLPRMGFHTRNMIGDIFMGLLDDVNPNDYYEVARKWGLDRAGRAANFDIVPGMSKSYKELMALYERNANAGFYRTDLNTYQTLSAGEIPQRAIRGTGNVLRNVSDTRETIGRFTHFVTAFRDEAKALFDKGMRDMDEIERRATDAALWRMNYYKFDYAALMPWEQGMKSLAFPFYTYMRKAAPTLIEQLYTNPRYFAKADRFMTYNDGSGADDFNSMNIPKWIRNMGYAVGDGKEPWSITGDILPTGALDIMSSGGTAKGLAENVLSNLNPLALIPAELAAGRTFHDDKRINSTYDYLMDKVPLVGDVAKEFRPDDRPEWQQLLNDSLLGAGLPIRRITTQQQQQQQQVNRDEAIDNPLKDFNYGQDAYFISTTENFTYRVTNKMTGEVMGEFATPTAAINAAQRLPGANYQHGYVDPYHVPTDADARTYLNLPQ